MFEFYPERDQQEEDLNLQVEHVVWVPCRDHNPRQTGYYLITTTESMVDVAVWSAMSWKPVEESEVPEVEAWANMPKPWRVP